MWVYLIIVASLARARPEATRVWGLKLLVYEALSYIYIWVYLIIVASLAVKPREIHGAMKCDNHPRSNISAHCAQICLRDILVPEVRYFSTRLLHLRDIVLRDFCRYLEPLKL